MSVKAQALVWDTECPSKVNGKEYKPSHKYLLVAYADHADHNGNNIWPAVSTIAKKTGLDERTVQRLTSDLSDMGMLLEDGKGPRGTNRWSLPFNDGGDKLTPPSNCRGDKNSDSLGDIPSGDIPSGDKLSPELNKPELRDLYPTDKTVDEVLQKSWDTVLEQLSRDMSRAQYTKYVADTFPVHFEDDCLQVCAANSDAREWLESRLQSSIEHVLVGILGRDVSIAFVAVETGGAA